MSLKSWVHDSSWCHMKWVHEFVQKSSIWVKLMTLMLKPEMWHGCALWHFVARCHKFQVSVLVQPQASENCPSETHLSPIWVRSESCLSMPPFTRCPVVKSCLLCTALSASLAAPGAVSSPHQRGWWWKLRPFQRLNWPSRPPTETDKPSPSKSLTKNLVRRRSWDPKWRWTHLIITIIINNLIGWSNIS